MRLISGPQNNGLEQTRGGGVPATRAVFRVSPRSSTRCCAYLCGGQIKKLSATMRAALRKDTNGVAMRRGGQLAGGQLRGFVVALSGSFLARAPTVIVGPPSLAPQVGVGQRKSVACR